MPDLKTEGFQPSRLERKKSVSTDRAQLFEALIYGLKYRQLPQENYQKCEAGLWGLGPMVPKVRHSSAAAIARGGTPPNSNMPEWTVELHGFL